MKIKLNLFCRECKGCYYINLRYVINKRYEHFYPSSFTIKTYHCGVDKQVKIKCLEC